jgi:cation diffusion facilitator CzcD-associated flavoprotein CzcO
MELNIWLSTTVSSAKYSDENKMWTVTLRRGDGTKRILHPKHVIFCTGHSGEPKIPTFPGQDDFEGSIYHGSEHKDASFSSDSLNTKRIVVVGTGNSAHDIAQNYHEAGAGTVTMLQRSGTYVIQAEKGLFLLHEGMYEEGGPPLEDADIAGQSLPHAVQFALNVGLTGRIKALEKENIEGLRRAGFKLDFGHDGSGISRKYLTRGGGYYIDVGASQLIVDGKIRVEQAPDGISHFEKKHVVLADGRKLEADVVVLATGYENMKTSVEKIFGHEEAGRCKDVWDLDEEGEVNAMWRPSGHPGLWFFGGNLALCRIYSRFLALQIAAIEAGLNSG